MTKKFVMAMFSLIVLAVIAVGSVSAGTYAPNITVGDTVFIGEEGLNITDVFTTTGFPVSTTTVLAYWTTGTPGTDIPKTTVPVVGSVTSFEVLSSDFSGYTGQWYLYNTSDYTQYAAAFSVYAPSVTTSIYNAETGDDISNKVVTVGDNVTFKITTNLNSLFTRGSNGLNPSPGTAGIDIKVKTPSGATLTALMNTTGQTALKGLQPMSSASYMLGIQTLSGSGDGIWTIDTSNYAAGTYEMWGVSNVNGMDDNIGVQSATKTLDISKDTVTVTADKDTVIRNNDFTVTVEGASSTYYYVWLSGTQSYNPATSEVDTWSSDIPPIVMPNQNNVDYLNASELAVQYKSGTTVSEDVATNKTAAGVVFNTFNGAIVKTSSSGTATIAFTTHANTKAATYTVRAEKYSGTFAELGELDNQYYDTVKVKVEEGAVTITASGEGSYYLGEQITFSGTNTDSDDVYLFIYGPNLGSNGADLDTPSQQVVTGNASTFALASVKTDDTWEYKLETSGLAIDAGSYTVYAVNEAIGKSDLGSMSAKYDTVSIVIWTPFVTATVSTQTLAKGDKLYIDGTAEGNPTNGVGIWILGTNYWNGDDSGSLITETVNDDGSFSYEFKDTSNLATGQYFVVVQHPMYNNVFNVVPETGVTDPRYVIEFPGSTYTAGYNTAFIIWGSGKLQGSAAAEALIDAIDSPDIDDTYCKLQFLIEEPWISIDTIPDQYVDDTFTISGTTNLAVDDELIIDVQSSSFTAQSKSELTGFSGTSATVKVVTGDSSANAWSMDVDTAGWSVDQYIVNVESIQTSGTSTTTFNVISGTPTATATATGTSTATATATATATSATPTTTAAPGFGALVALIGLGAVAALVLRKE